MHLGGREEKGCNGSAAPLSVFAERTAPEDHLRVIQATGVRALPVCWQITTNHACCACYVSGQYERTNAVLWLSRSSHKQNPLW